VLLWGAANSKKTNQLEGFDIQLAQEIAKALGVPIEYRVISTAQRIPSLQDGSVDVVLRRMTINCERWKQIQFSAVYYDAGQRLLVRNEAGAPSTLQQLFAKDGKVCVVKGTTNLDYLKKNFPAAKQAWAASAPGPARIEADLNGECLVRFQRGDVDAILGDDTVLAGFAAQDGYAKLVGGRMTDEPYGVGVKQGRTDLTRFVNAVLEELRRNGRWQEIYRTTMGTAGSGVPTTATPPAPVYGRR
jgi:polar amino acid transport system substrate-binding protein